MKDYLIHLTSLINSEHIQIFIISMLPVTELRFSIPYGILIKSMKVSDVFLLSMFGNIIIGIII